jgi:hypothetical protein
VHRNTFEAAQYALGSFVRRVRDEPDAESFGSG